MQKGAALNDSVYRRCINCRSYIREKGLSLCKKETNCNLVTGEIYYASADMMRMQDYMCGSEAEWFEPK